MRIHNLVAAVGTVCLLYQCQAARILGIFPVPSISHQVVYRAVMEALAKRGHEITVLTPDPARHTDRQFQNITEIDVHDLSYGMFNSIFNFASSRSTNSDPRSLYGHFKSAMADIIDEQLQVPEMKAILENREQHFDLIFVESLFPIHFVAGSHFSAPVIGISSLSGLLSNFDAVANPTHPILYPDVFCNHVGELNFWQRLDSVYGDLYIRYIDWTFSDTFNKVAKKHYSENAPTVEEAERQMSMLFVNVHHILNGILPVVPAVVYLGGSHLKATKPLPKDLKNFLDKSKQGVIYMSLGSNVKSKDLSFQIIDMFIEVFRELPYNVLWKFENDTLLNKPSNVFISKWLPQNDMLGHKNIKAFITQGGQQSMEEAIYHHVPLIGIPFIGDQDFNVKKMIHMSIGKGLNIATIEKSSLKEAILEVAENVKYRESITRLSKLLEDRPDTGLERAVWWSEYVMRHGGAGHLRAPSVPLYQYLMLDILAFGVLTASTVVLAFYVVLGSILRWHLREGKRKKQ